jgi:hypothetical protein
MKQITQLGKGKFAVKSENGTKLPLDFNPIIDRLSDRQKETNYFLIHWQGKPKGDREWGIYDSRDDSYRCGIFENHPTAYGAVELIMLDDTQNNLLPSAVVWFKGSLPI